mgnify:CR=1 FL=1
MQVHLGSGDGKAGTFLDISANVYNRGAGQDLYGVPLTRVALLFGPADYFSLMVLGLMFAVVLARGSILKAIAIIVLVQGTGVAEVNSLNSGDLAVELPTGAAYISTSGAFVSALVPLVQLAEVSDILKHASMETSRWVVLDASLNALEQAVIYANAQQAEQIMDDLVKRRGEVV